MTDPSPAPCAVCTTTASSDTLTALILAGGQGSRMDGADKGLVLFAGMPLFLHAIEKIRPHARTILISANRNLSVYAGFGFQVVQDASPDYAGPLAGIQAGLQHCSSPLMLVVPCDVPGFPDTLVKDLHEGLMRNQADIAVVRHAADLQAAFLMMKSTVLPHLQDYLGSGRRSIHGWLEAAAQAGLLVAPVDVQADLASFANLNTLPDLLAHEPAFQLPDQDC